ncbi:MAG: LPS export ABC transporter periplasmic protein LptC [Prevotella sp.]|jgi:LPS export ABC transporter protein LptC|nr:LPS export ABC transporter periplasmic protein LptC [Prevotella sp.]
MVKGRFSIFNIQYSIIVIAAFFCISCSKEKAESVDAPLDNEVWPNMAVDSVTELISDSGIIRYKLITESWLFFEKAKDPRWYFPKGLYVEQFDTLFRVQVTIKADTAWNYLLRKLWKLKGHVFVRNIRNETFESDELYWDERTGKVYSDVYIKIVRPNKMDLQGIGFLSNQQMTDFEIHRPYDGAFYYEEEDRPAMNEN